jgi:hypothetical protein
MRPSDDPTPRPPPTPSTGPLRGANIGSADVIGCAGSPGHRNGEGEPASVLDPFGVLRGVTELLAGYPRPWAICGGWAIDLFLGRVTREHKDIDVAIARRDQLTMQAHLSARGWQLEIAHNGVLTPWRAGEYIELPRHGIWARHPTSRPNFVEILLNEIDATHFHFRRDPTIVVPLAQVFITTVSGLPVIMPEIALLYKSAHAGEPENQADFDAALPSLDPERRAWLRAALGKTDGQHPWLRALDQVRA